MRSSLPGAESMVRLASFVSLLLVFPSHGVAQERVTVEELLTMMNEQRAAVMHYREGRTDEALAIAGARSPSLNDVIARRILVWIQGPEPELRDPQGNAIQLWTPKLVVSLAAVHMELALRMYVRRDTIQAYRTQVKIAGMLIEFAADRGEAPAHFLERWTLAIGTTAHADGQLWWALAILDEGCRSNHSLVAYLVACGAAEESLARLPAHEILSGGGEDAFDVPAFGSETRSRAAAERKRRLGSARRAFERALKLEPRNTEARLRLAHVRMELGETNQAAALLEPLVGDDAPRERRAAFLARLFLGALRARSGQHDAAVEILRKAVDLVPSAQSAQVALASALRRAGRVAEATGVVDRLFDAPLKPPDPWGSYAFGLYWMPGELLPELRAEARR